MGIKDQPFHILGIDMVVAIYKLFPVSITELTENHAKNKPQLVLPSHGLEPKNVEI